MSGPPPGRTVPGNRWDLLADQWPADPPDVTVVVVHFEQPRQLERTLAALRRQTHPAERLQTIVVDDGSRVAPVVPEGVLLLRQEDRGFRAAAARNLGARSATGEVLCFLDADTSPEPDYLRRISRLPALAAEAVVVGRREHADLRQVSAQEPVETAGPRHRLAAPAWLEEAHRESHDLLSADHRSYRFVIAAVLACHRWFFERLGGFDESITAYGGEDWEWAIRAWQDGSILAHEPLAVAWHDGPDWAGRDDARTRRQAKNHETMTLLRRHALPAARPRALRLAPADLEVRLGAAPSPAAALVVVDSLLRSLPHADVRVPAEAAWITGHDDRVRVVEAVEATARVVVDHAGDARVHPDDLLDAVRLLDDRQLGSVRCVDAQGQVVASLHASRALRRAARWGRDDLFESMTTRVRSERVPDDPDLEAYVGGW